MQILKISVLFVVILLTCNLQPAHANSFDLEDFDIDLEKYVNGADADAAPGIEIFIGDIVTFTYEASLGDGIGPLKDLLLLDDNGPDDPNDDFQPTFIGGDDNNNNVLDVGEIWLYEATEIALAGQNRNLATLEGTAIDILWDDGSSIMLMDQDPANYTGVAPIPEPSSLFLLCFGLISLAGFGRKKLLKK